jgi:hypothetical protein
MNSPLSRLHQLWNRHWRIMLVVVALVTVFVLGTVFGQQLTLSDLEPTTAPTPTINPTATITPIPITGPTLTFRGDIVDAQTGQPVVADVYVDDELVQESVTQVDLTVRLDSDRLTEIRVVASGYQDWGIAVRGGSTGKLIEESIQLIPIEPTAPAVPEA